MTLLGLIARSLRYYWRTNLAVILGVAVAVTVLAGALLVGESVRASLRELATGRLGKADQAISGAAFFREKLASEIGGAPLIIVEGIVTHEASGARASRVQVYGVDERFWQFHGMPAPASADREALLGESLAQELGAKPGDSITVRMAQPSDIPSESLHGHKDDPGRTIRFLLGQPVSGSVGEFSLRPRQGVVRTMFVPLRRLQRDLKIQNRVNTILVAGDSPLDELLNAKYSLEDIGIKLRPLDEGRGLAVETESAILTDQLAERIEAAAQDLKLRATPILSYLANSIRANGREVPYSLVTAIDLDAVSTEDGIGINDWTVRELGAKPGDIVTLDYYIWQPNGNLLTKSAEFKLAAILPMKGIAADRDLAPEYPGISDAGSLGDWNPPFPMDLKRIRPADEQYWNRYRATPKAFIPLKRGQELWASRFGSLTSVRVQGETSGFAEALRGKLKPVEHGFTIERVREQARAASQGATDFGEYFTYFSFFLMMSALLLAGLFFRLGVEQRLQEIGTLRATGLSFALVRRMLAGESLLLALAGGIAGMLGAIAYGWLILFGLRTWWIDAVGTRMLRLHVEPGALLGGMAGGVIAAMIALALSFRAIRKRSPRSLLSGVAEPHAPGSRRLRDARLLAIVSAVAALAMLGAAMAERIEKVGGFFGAGALLLIAAFLWQWTWLSSTSHGAIRTISALGLRASTYRPGRSILCIALVASATFLIVSVDSFRRDSDSTSGTGGFPLLAESALPLLYDMNTTAGRENLNLDSDALNGAKFFSFRLRPGDDASCLNLYQPSKPRVLGVPAEFVNNGRFAFQSALTETDNPWLLLDQRFENGAIPAIVDANSMTYVLHRKLGDELILDKNGAEPVRLRLVAALKDSILQSEILVSEANFIKLFPEQQGHRYFLIDVPPQRASGVTKALEESLSDYGFDIENTGARLAEFHRVANTYLSTFQTLGGLGLILGAAGFGAVVLRNVLERRREVALLRAIGYRPEHLRRLLLAENAMLLVSGLAIGALCALVAIAPAAIERGGRLPLLSVATLVVAVFGTGLLASLFALRALRRLPIVGTLRAE